MIIIGRVMIFAVYPHNNTFDSCLALFGKYKVDIIRRLIADGTESLTITMNYNTGSSQR